MPPQNGPVSIVSGSAPADVPAAPTVAASTTQDTSASPATVLPEQPKPKHNGFAGDKVSPAIVKPVEIAPDKKAQ